ncbi:Pentatricopeptide repeat protein [Melia azedarach]|uniref:Pentatricopeptide repeat protein n=1 Tax=Melia azedarach TaxID=155640 RepID=A0ACC1WW81_MELAZ|nr:Pentatricopeptide repeat protein [Melia azedarach]
MENKQHSPAYQAILKAGPRLKPLQQVHAHLIVLGYGRSRSLLTKLLSLACDAGFIGYAQRVFFCIPNPDSFLFNTLIIRNSKASLSADALFFYRRLLLSNIPPSNYTFSAVIKSCAFLSALEIGKVIHGHVFVAGYHLDSHVQAALVSFYAKSNSLDVARKVFDKMPEKSVVAWNSMISGYEQNGLAKEAIGVFYLMRDLGVQPDSTTCVCVLSACAQLGDIGLGCWVHDYIVGRGIDVNVVLGTSLINMYARCGNVSKAREVFDLTSELNVVAWTAMISGYGMHGYACAHAGLVQEGRQVFAIMTQEYRLVPGVEHHVCMVDLFGRAGLLNEAYKFIREVIGEKPAPAVWTAMLGACKMHKNFDLGVEVAEHLLSDEPENPGHYVMLSNIYALAGRMDRVEMIRNKMIQKGLKKHVGYSTIEVDQKNRLFSMGDKSHPDTNEIYQYLDELMSRCREAGYVPESESALHELEEEEREYALRYHSEKLAIAFGLLRTSPGMTYQNCEEP